MLLKPAKWACYPAGHLKLSKAEVARLSRMGLQRGWPDLLVIWNGSIYGLEIKRPGGTLSRTTIARTRSGAPRVLVGQEEVFPELMAAGMKIAFVTSVEEMLLVLAHWGIPVRAHH